MREAGDRNSRCLTDCPPVHQRRSTAWRHPADPAAWHIRPDPARISALVTGYRRERTPTAIELELLQAGIEYGIAFIAAIHLDQALRHGVHGPHMDNRWNRIRNRLAASTDIAAMAARAFTRPGP
jgi:hypothetical protein